MDTRLFKTIILGVSLLFGSTAATAVELPKVYVPGVRINAMSDNAAYALSSVLEDENSGSLHRTGGKLFRLSDYTTYNIPASLGWAEANDVSDDGIVVGANNGKPGYYDYQTGKWTVYNVPREWGGGSFNAVTPDGQWAVGYYFSAFDEYNVAPMVYNLTTGESKQLLNLPKVDLSGEDQHQNVFYDISPDGRYVLGQMSQSYLMPVALFSYIYDLQTDTWRAIGYDYDEATKKFTCQIPDLHFVSNQMFSCDGQWVTGSVYMVHDDGEAFGGSEDFYPYRYNVATGQMEVFYTNSDAKVSGNKVTADGTLLASAPVGNPYPSAMIRSGNYFIPLELVFQQVYGRTTQSLVGDEVTGAFECISADGLTAVMVTYDYCYILTMPESFAEAAAKVNLLANYAVDIPNGSAISKISEINIAFDRPIECSNNPQAIRLLDSNGQVVRTAAGLGVSHENENVAVVTFRSTTLNPGEKYTVDIPAGMAWLKDDSNYKTEPISISYTGRANAPVQLERISPASGSAVNQLNSNPDFVTLTFDCPVSLSSTALCRLFNADDDTQIALMGMSYSGNQVYLFPTAAYNLYKGTNYRIVVSEGSITDLSGAGPCGEIVIEYQGSYVRQLSDDDVYIFKSTCDNYDDFMIYKSQFHEPNSVATSWGFELGSTWMLVRDSDLATDMALAAHSMYEPAAESDDWLVTPQLYIPDDNVFLAFDAQSYLYTKHDRLQVVVYADDAFYNYITTEVVENMVDHGDIVFDEELSAGATDEGLNGEWTHYTVNLGKYAGQNVYIAFVNQNYNQSAVFVDNVYVMRNMNFVLTNQTPTTVVMQTQVPVRGMVSIASETNTYQGITLVLTDGDGNEVDHIADPTVKLAHNDIYTFAFDKPLPVEPGYEAEYTITVQAGDEQSAFGYVIQDLTYEPTKRVVLEEFTGSSCPNCPLGILAIENLKMLYPDNFIPLTLRTYQSDMYAAGAVDYTNFLNLSAAPSARINRGEILAPMLNNGSAGFVFYGRGIMTVEGTEAYLWGDAVQDELSIPAIVDVDIDPIYDSTTGDIEISCDVKFALNQTVKSVGLFAVVIENHLPTYQMNNLYMTNDPNLGDWGQGGRYSQSTVTSWQADDVVRYVVSGQAFNGELMDTQDFAAGETYGMTLSGQIPNDRLYNPSNCQVVVMVIDRSSGKVLNANIKNLIKSGINDIETDNGEAVYYNLQGMRVANPTHGNVYIRVIGNKSQKILY